MEKELERPVLDPKEKEQLIIYEELEMAQKVLRDGNKEIKKNYSNFYKILNELRNILSTNGKKLSSIIE